MAELFQSTKQSISLHIRNVFEEGELDPRATVKENLTVQTEGKRQVSRAIQLYSLPIILAVGFRVRSPRGTQFRRWASAALSEYLVKGFVMNDDQLKNPDADYFEELLARIRDIRSSETSIGCFLSSILASHDPDLVPVHLARRNADAAPRIKSCLRSLRPIFDVLPSFVFPPVEN